MENEQKYSCDGIDELLDLSKLQLQLSVDNEFDEERDMETYIYKILAEKLPITIELSDNLFKDKFNMYLITVLKYFKENGIILQIRKRCDDNMINSRIFLAICDYIDADYHKCYEFSPSKLKNKLKLELINNMGSSRYNKIEAIHVTNDINNHTDVIVKKLI